MGVDERAADLVGEVRLRSESEIHVRLRMR